ncbi:MAG TPA: aldose 1-epimerase family protein [Patescibacteria group bacterium]|nr:aldose 1-epimerase family protein [Patescibacteria group bacterium]
MDRHTIIGDGLTATIAADGAELCSLRDSRGEEMLWQAEAAWPRHAPLLFPIVGKLKDDQLRHAGTTTRLTQHGFARDSRFTWVEQGPRSCRLRLEDSAETRAVYPFAFRFEVIYAVDDDRLNITYVIANPGTEVLPASAGAHPAFRWPLRDGIAKDAHWLEFAEAEPHPIRRLGPDGLLDATGFPSPVEGKILPLIESLFKISAIIIDQSASRSVRYCAPGAPVIEVSWDGFFQLGLWMKPGAEFLCIEPWHGMTSPADFDGDFIDKPGLLLIPPGEQRELTHRIRVIV